MSLQRIIARKRLVGYYQEIVKKRLLAFVEIVSRGAVVIRRHLLIGYVAFWMRHGQSWRPTRFIARYTNLMKSYLSKSFKQKRNLWKNCAIFRILMKAAPHPYKAVNVYLLIVLR